MIAALFVDGGGVYAGLEGVELWDEELDATRYAGPWPVIAHPPCARWCRLAGFVESRYPHLKAGEDGGLFASALASVRRWGGVLEHPAFSTAFSAYGLPIPSGDGWQRGICGGWSCYVEQGRYGHPAKKATWLYAYGIEEPPSLRWGRITGQARVGGGTLDSPLRGPRLEGKQAAATPPAFAEELVKTAKQAKRWSNEGDPSRPYVTKKERSATPEAFRNQLVAIAAQVRQ